MRAGQNFFLENKKGIKQIFVLRFDFFRFNIDIKKYIFHKKILNFKIFLPWIFFENMDL